MTRQQPKSTRPDTPLPYTTLFRSVFILNNQYMGMVRQWQELTYSSRYSQSYSESLPDFVKLAEAYGWKGIRIETRDQLDDGIADMLGHDGRSEEHTSELQSLMRISYAVFCLKKKKKKKAQTI